MLKGIAGAASSASFVSCISRTSGARWASHPSTRSMRALRELTFQVAMRIRASELTGPGRRHQPRRVAASAAGWRACRRLVASALLPGEVELGRVGDAHHGHRAGLDRVGDHEIGYVWNGAGHVQRDDRDAEFLDLNNGLGDVTAHDRAGHQEGASPVKVGHRADCRRKVLLADERNGVDGDLLAAEVVAVGLANGAEACLGDLRPAADDDEPLAEYLVEGLRHPAAAEGREPVEDAGDLLFGQAFDFQLDFHHRAVRLVRPSPDRAKGSESTAVLCNPGGDFGKGFRPVGIVEPDGDCGGGVVRSRHGQPTPNPRSARPWATRGWSPISMPASASCSSKARPRSANACRVPAASLVASISAPSVSSAMPTIALMLMPRSPRTRK